MARMIPEHGPNLTESHGERHLYSVLKSNLSDDYVVFHSLPWLCSAVNKLDGRARPTGEIDFLIIHPEDGVLALEVKSGVYRVENSVFVHVRDGFKIDPLNQTKRNVHGFATWLGADPSLRLKIGYGFVFPDSDFDKSNIPGMYDTQANPPQPLYIDFEAYPDVAHKIVGLMKYWKRALQNPDLGRSRADVLIDYLAPKVDGQPKWASRIRYDNKTWLQLTTEQSSVVRNVLKSQNSLITGWPGTGKTVLAIEAARKYTAEGKRVLLLSFNGKLTDHIRNQLDGYDGCTVLTWHGLCRMAAGALERSFEGEAWFRVQCLEDLKLAISRGLLGDFDALIVDESQALAESWCQVLIDWFGQRPKVFFCDETQVFNFERNGVPLERLKAILAVDVFTLTIVLRMPKAVTEILAEVMPPKFQLSSPRLSEADTALEIVTIDPGKELFGIKERLMAGGVDAADIVILVGSRDPRKYIEMLGSSNLTVEGIAKYRGLESPVVIVLGAEALDTAELFSAYSRATTKFIAIYNATNPEWKGHLGFQARLQGNSESEAILTKAQEPLRIRSLVQASTNTRSLGTKSLDLMWAEDWQALLVELETHESQMRLWVNYLNRVISHPVFVWFKDTLNKFYAVATVTDGEFESYYNFPLVMGKCKACDSITPCTSPPESHCVLCATVESRLLPPDPHILAQVCTYDGAITSQFSRERSLELRSQLPLEVAAVASFLHAKKHRVRDRVLLLSMPSGRQLYETAFVFAQSRIATCLAGGTLSVDAIADEIYERYQSLKNVTAAEWRSNVAMAFATIKEKGYAVRVGKKLYRPVEDADAPPPKRFNYD